MRSIIQRVANASVMVDEKIIGKIGQGFLVLLGVGKEDTEADLVYLAEKILNLRVFSDCKDKMNLSIQDISGELLIISQFTLYGDCRKGRRPSFDKACLPQEANEMYQKFVEYCKQTGLKVETGVFGADMKVALLNDGPVTLMLDSKKKF